MIQIMGDLLYTIIFVAGIIYGWALGMMFSRVFERWSKAMTDWLIRRLCGGSHGS